MAAADFQEASQPGPYEVESRLGEWVDGSRGNRDLPWRVFLPEGTAAPAPVIVFSPGGGSRDDESGYWGAHLASHGFAVFHLQHRGSDADAIRRVGAAAAFKAIRESKPSGAVLRQQDVLFAVDQITLLAQGDLAGRIDSDRMGMSGFSFGAITALIAAGQKFPELGQSLAVPRFRAAFAMAPSARHGIAAPVLSRDEAEPIYDAMLMPVFHLTGTQDSTPPPSATTPEDRQAPFRLIRNVDQYLLVLNDAVHRTFSGKEIDSPGFERHRELIKMATVVFWRAHLLGDAGALDWLQGPGFAAQVGRSGSFEFKPGAKVNQ